MTAAADEPTPTVTEMIALIAMRLPSLSSKELDALADAVEALTDAIGLQRDWGTDAPAEERAD
jgi:hypothetical protein